MSAKIIEISGPLPPFILPLRNAIHSGNKTETRRVLKPQPPTHYKLTYVGKTDTADTGAYGAEFHDGAHEAKFYPCRYGRPGQYRYMREPLIKGLDGFAHYEDDEAPVLDHQYKQVEWRWKVKRLAQIYLPAEYARTFVQITDIRVEQVQQMTWQDCLAEGVSDLVLLPVNANVNSDKFHAAAKDQIRDNFLYLWDTINAERGFPWESNPWVWVVKFELLHAPA